MSKHKKRKNKHIQKPIETPVVTDTLHLPEEIVEQQGEFNKQVNNENTDENCNYISINIPKKKDKGEDADPLYITQEGLAFVGVFDGMGGSGSTEYTTPNGIHTGAYFASRKVCKTCKEYINEATSDVLDIDMLSKRIKEDLTQCMEQYGIKPSGLRSSIIRILPTTLTIIGAHTEGNNTHITSYWCGDSRNYILTKQGLLQVSEDDLSKKQDPLENLRNDESLSNCICQDKPFTIHVKDCGVYTEPIMIISATDGCFGYLKSPMHFEYLLLSTLVSSQNSKDWQDKLESYLKTISGDDFSLSIAMINGNFMYWRNNMVDRFSVLKNKYISPIDDIEEEIVRKQEWIANAQKEMFDTITNLWGNYKELYMSKISE